jgi:uncharacterized protein (DUF2141 family)
MTTIRTKIAAALIGIMATAVPLSTVFAAELAVTVQGVRSDKGNIMAQLLKADAAQGKAVQAAGTMQQAKAGTLELLFSNLAPGDYAVMLFHDENGNTKMDSNIVGIPTEGYGFSNNAKGSFGPPKFSAMKVTVGTAGRVTTTAPLNY